MTRQYARNSRACESISVAERLTTLAMKYQRVINYLSSDPTRRIHELATHCLDGMTRSDSRSPECRDAGSGSLSHVRKDGEGTMQAFRRVLMIAIFVAMELLGKTQAQEGPTDTAGVSSYSLPTVVVTSTRVARDGYDAPTPTTVVGPDMLELRNPGTLADALALLPEMRNPETEGTGSLVFGVGAGRGFVNLRGLGPNRTLVLLDGERLVDNTLSAQPDLSLLPSALISRVEIVSGGAAAAYGSDAVAGVVNFVLDSHFTGFKVNVSGGTSSRSDATEGKVALTWGGSLRDGLNMVASAEYYHRDGLGPGSRDFATPAQIVPNPEYTASDGQRPLAVIGNAYDANQSYGGLILNGPLARQQFLPNGTTVPYAPSCTVSQPDLLCDSRQDLASARNAISLTAPQERGSAFVRTTWDAADNVTARLDVLLAHSETSITSVPFNSRGFNIFLPINVAENAFLPASVRSLYLASGIATLMLGRMNADEGAFEETISENSARIAAGVNARLPGSWSLDAFLTYSDAHNGDRRDNDYDISHFLNAVDSVLVNGVPTCRINAVTVVDPNCAPANIFGTGNMSAAAKAYFLGTVYKPLNTSQYDAAINVRGEPFATWVGPVSVAVGGEYRRDAADQQSSDPNGLYAFSGQPAFSGSTEVGEAYVEGVAPLAKDAFLMKSLDVDAAARLAHYSQSGLQSAWKIGANWTPWRGVRIRAVGSQDIRAPNIGELDTPVYPSSIDTLPNPLPNGLALLNSRGIAPGQSVNVQEIDGGNPNLKPEVAHTVSVGLVLQPSNALTASVDHYRIKLDNAITALSVPTIIQSCAAGETSACALISLPAGATLPVVQNPLVNAESFVTSGIDIEAMWRQTVPGGSVTVRTLANYILEYTQLVPGGPEQDLRGDIGSGLPALQGDISIEYLHRLTTVLLSGTYIGAGDFDKALASEIQNDHVPHVWYLGASVRYELPVHRGNCAAYAGVNNLLDQAPPHVGFGIFSSENNGIFSGVPYDRIGRYFRAGVTAKF
jgi:iron complex outermembrane receptor protein